MIVPNGCGARDSRTDMPAAVDDDRLAGEIARVQDEQDGAGHVFRAAFASEWRRCAQALRVGVTPVLRQEHSTGRDGADAHFGRLFARLRACVFVVLCFGLFVWVFVWL